MQNPDTHDLRLTALEIKASFTEDLVDKLEQIVTRQQQQIDELIREVLRLRDQASVASATPQRTALDDLPPHY
jgi:SlyX protein